ncbi:MAG: DNA polymerase III subunit delta [Pseudomonadota bacterium]
MKLSPRDAPAYFAKPDPSRAGILIYGADAMRVSLRRQDVVSGLVGPNGEDEMRLTRIAANELRKDPASLLDAIKAQGFFPGPRVALVEGATDAGLGPIETALGAWQAGDAALVVTAGSLAAKSKLRKLFEGHGSAYATGIYDDPPSRGEIEGVLKAAGIRDVDRDGMDAITGLSRVLDPGDFRQTIEKIALYTLKSEGPVTVEDVSAMSPASIEAALDDVIHATAEARMNDIAPLLRRLQAQGVGGVTLAIGLMRHFRQLHSAASDPGGAASGAGKLRPPVFGPRRDRLVRQAGSWGPVRLDEAVSMILAADAQLRRSSPVPDMAMMERLLVRLARLGGR